MADDSFGERTEKATGRKRAEARRKGQVAKSREIPSVAVLLTGVSVLFVLSGFLLQRLSAAMAQGLAKAGAFPLNPENLRVLQAEALWTLAQILGPVMAAIMAAAILANYSQVGSLFSLEIIQPKFSTLNPLKGFSKLFSWQAVVELFKSLGKMGIIAYVAYTTIRDEAPAVAALADQEMMGILAYIGRVASKIFLKTLLVLVVLAGADYLAQRWMYERNLRMTKREVKEDARQAEGDPLVKSRIRSIQRDLARKRMMAEVPKADVVITNPTHLAVALHYRRERMAAPKLLAKGAGLIAERIKEIARAHQIPILEHKPLAQVLFKTVELNQVIPSSLYQMVADLLAHVYRLRKRAL